MTEVVEKKFLCVARKSADVVLKKLFVSFHASADVVEKKNPLSNEESRVTLPFA